MDIYGKMTNAMANDVYTKSDQDKTCFMLSGCRSPFTVEWLDTWQLHSLWCTFITEDAL